MSKRGLIIGSVMALAISGIAAPAGISFERYQVILERKPFGSETAPAPAGAPGSPAATAAAAVNALKMSAIIEDSAGKIVVGIFDPQQNASYMMKIGETENGIELLTADYSAERAQIRKDGFERWISMSGEDSPATLPDQAPTLAAKSRTASPRTTRRSMAPLGKGMTRAEYEKIKSKLPQPRSAKRALQDVPDEPPLTQEEHETVLQEYNMELIRAEGELGPALPIELTPDQDAQLVREGVLPPIE